MVMESDGNVGRALKNGGRIKRAATEEEKEEDEEKDEEEDEKGKEGDFLEESLGFKHKHD